MDMQAYERMGWYADCDYFFEFNPFVSVEQATAYLYETRQPLFSVFRHMSGGIVVFKGQKSVTTDKFATYQHAFDYVEQLIGYQPPKIALAEEVNDKDVDAALLDICPTCATPILNLHLFAGRPAKYCSDACKMKAYRQRSNGKALRNEPLRNTLASPVTRSGYQQTTWLDIAS